MVDKRLAAPDESGVRALERLDAEDMGDSPDESGPGALERLDAGEDLSADTLDTPDAGGELSEFPSPDRVEAFTAETPLPLDPQAARTIKREVESRMDMALTGK